MTWRLLAGTSDHLAVLPADEVDWLRRCAGWLR